MSLKRPVPCVQYWMKLRMAMAAVRLIDYCWPKTVLEIYLPLLSVLSSTNLEASTIYLKKKKKCWVLYSERKCRKWMYHLPFLMPNYPETSSILTPVCFRKSRCGFRLPSSEADWARKRPCSLLLLFSGCLSSFSVSFSLLCIMPFYHSVLIFFPKIRVCECACAHTPVWILQ